jgi:hypothetical protein
MLLYLPRNVAPLSKVVARAEHYRYGATCHIHVVAHPNGLYRAEATDGRRLAVVQGPFDASAEPYDWLPADWNAEDGEAFVPRDSWDEAFKLPDSLRKGRPIGLTTTEGGAVVLGCEGSKIGLPPNEIGRWPNVSQVLPKRPASVVIRFDPTMLLDILKLAAALHSDSPWVELLYFGKDVPFGIVTANDSGQSLDALVVPLTPTKEESHGPRN